MGQAIAVRMDFTAGEVRRVAKQAKDSGQARRLLAIAAVLEGASREDRSVAWTVKRCGTGRSGSTSKGRTVSSTFLHRVPPKLGKKHRAFLVRLVEEGPIPAVHAVVRWRGLESLYSRQRREQDQANGSRKPSPPSGSY